MFSYLCHAILQFLALCVQAFMLLQVTLFYLRLWWKNRKTPVTEGLQKTLVEHVSSVDFGSCTMSCIIMTRNEEASIVGALGMLASMATRPELLEVILVDTGSTDKTVEAAVSEASAQPYRFVQTAATGGRGAALDAGSRAASGDVIFAMHADCVPPRGFDDWIRTGLATPGVLATAFRFQLNRKDLAQPLPGAGIMEFTVNIRSSLLQLPFGDQGIAISKRMLENYGGWGGEAYPLLEDFQLVQKLRLDGLQGAGRIRILPAPIRCSPRRWVKLGVWRVNLVNQLTMIWYMLGAKPQDLFDFYYGVRSDCAPMWLRFVTAFLTAPLVMKGASKGA